MHPFQNDDNKASIHSSSFARTGPKRLATRSMSPFEVPAGNPTHSCCEIFKAGRCENMLVEGDWVVYGSLFAHSLLVHDPLPIHPPFGF
jgi:hypothetical protein